MVAALPAMLLVLVSLGKRTVTGLDAFAFYSNEKGAVKNERKKDTLIMKISGKYCLNYPGD